MKIDIVSAFWSFYWRAVLFGLGAGFVIGLVGALTKAEAGVTGIAILCAGVAANYFGFKLGLNKYGIVQAD